MKDKDPYTILLVEDNPGDQALIEEYLEDQILNPTVVHAGSYKDAYAALTSGENAFDVILLDISLPDKSGEPLIRDVVTQSRNIPLIILTGYTDIAFSIKSLALGVSDYLLKDDLNAVSLYKSIRYNIERHKHALELIDSEKRYSDLFHLSPQPMWVYCLDSLQFLDVNQAAIDHYGYSEEEFLAMTIRDIRLEVDIQTLEQDVQELRVNASRGHSKSVYRHKKKSGELIFVDIRGNVIDYKGKKSEVVLVNDITDRLKYIAAIEEQNNRLRDIAWKQSHEVRAPLARIMGLVNLIDKIEGSNITQDELFKLIMKSAHDLDRVIREITSKTDMVSIDQLHEGDASAATINGKVGSPGSEKVTLAGKSEEY